MPSVSARAVASRQLEISQCLKSWGPLRAKLEELKETEQAAIDTLLSNALHPADINDLNIHLLQKKAIDRVFLLVEELKEDLHPEELSSDAE